MFRNYLAPKEKGWTAVSSDWIPKSLMETFAYAFTDFPFMETQTLYFFKEMTLSCSRKKALKILPNYGTTEAQSWP